jgi:hypothetical protein
MFENWTGDNAGIIMQVNASAPVDPALTAVAIDNQIEVAVAVKARQVQKMQGDALVDLVKDAAQVSEQIARGHIDVQL